MRTESYQFDGTRVNLDVLACPNTGEPCPARVLLDRLYSEVVIAQFDPAGDCAPRYDDVKLGLKLTEHEMWAKAIGCSGVEEGVCPTREYMDSSTPRNAAVTSFRGLRKIYFALRGSR